MSTAATITTPQGELPITEGLPEDVVYQWGSLRVYVDPGTQPGDLDRYQIEAYDDDAADWEFLDARRDFETAVAELARIRESDRAAEIRKDLRERIILLQRPASLEALIGFADKLRRDERQQQAANP